MNAEPIRSLEKFVSSGKEIRLETFSDPRFPNAPSVLVLHGATGVEFANRFIANLALNIASQGFVVYLVHYFDRTGAIYADDAMIKRSSEEWLQTIHDAILHVRKTRPRVAIGVFGYSLGGYLAAAESVRDPNVAAAVVLAGGLDEGSAHSARQAPPVLILHGTADDRVPVIEAYRLESTLQRLGRKPELHLYVGEGHIMSMPAYADVVSRSGAFLQKNLTSLAR